MQPRTTTKIRQVFLLFYFVLASVIVSKEVHAAGEEGMVLDLKVNQTQRGEFLMYRTPQGDYLIRLSDAPQLGLRRGIDWPLVRIEGESGSFISLRSLGATRLEYDGNNQALDIELPADLFEKTSIDLISSSNRIILPNEQTSGFLNYRLADTAYGTANSYRTLAAELGLRSGSVLFLNQTLSRDDGSTARYLT
jgi:outer membrane usher protein FimD/PapC